METQTNPMRVPIVPPKRFRRRLSSHPIGLFLRSLFRPAAVSLLADVCVFRAMSVSAQHTVIVPITTVRDRDTNPDAFETAVRTFVRPLLSFGTLFTQQEASFERRTGAST